MSGTIKQFPRRNTEEPQPDKLLTIDEAAALLGLTPKALRHRVARRTIQFRKDGKRVVFSQRALLEHISGLPTFEAID